MVISRIKERLSNNNLNFRSVSLNKKIVVIESDDWGTIRMPSQRAFNNLLSAGVKVNKCAYNTNDTLASFEDLEELYRVLEKIKDAQGNHPMITANTIVANPDFEKIEKSNFKKYDYELFTDTLKRYYPNQDVFSIWQEGMSQKLFYPQFHGREHLNVNRWLKSLEANMPETKLAFENKLFGLSTTITSEKRKSYLAAFDFDNKKELDDHKEILEDGLQIFESIFGYRSQSFIAPNYTWNSALEPTLKKLDINYMQGARAQREPIEGDSVKIKKHYSGDRNHCKQIFLARNVTFEPTLNNNKDWVKDALQQISTAFYWNSPAIISTHRLNYIGELRKNNREKSLVMLHDLLVNIIKKWPNVEFMTSDELGRLIANKN